MFSILFAVFSFSFFTSSFDPSGIKPKFYENSQFFSELNLKGNYLKAKEESKCDSLESNLKKTRKEKHAEETFTQKRQKNYTVVLESL